MRKSKPVSRQTPARIGLLCITFAMLQGGCAESSRLLHRDVRSPEDPAGEIPGKLQVPKDEALVLKAVASGQQRYECRLTDSGYSWTFVASDAALYDASEMPSGHYGPDHSWTWSDQSRLTARVVASVPSSGERAVPLLLLEATSSAGPGALATVSHVQRLRTFGGRPPAAECDAGRVGQSTGTPFSAEFLFYRRR